MTARRPLHILYHHRTQGRGVERVHITGVVDAWRRSGHHVDVVSPPGVNTEQPARAEAVRGRGVLGWLAGHAPTLCFELMEVLYNVRGVVKLWSCHRRRRYDLVYERYAFLNLAGLLTSRMAAVPFVLEVNFTSGTVMERARSRAARLAERWVERRLFRRADVCVVVSTRLRELLIQAGVDASRILVQPNAADAARFDPRLDARALRAALGLEGALVVGFVGHFSKWHGVQLLCDAFDLVRERVPNASFLLVGDGNTRAAIGEMVRARGWTRSVLLPGRIPHSDVPRYVALFDVAVMPGSNDYGSPMKIPEYMAAGKAVVAPRLSPIEDLVDDGRTGIMFEPGSVPGLAEAVVALLSDPERRRTIGQAARREVEQVHNWDRAAERILAQAERTVRPGAWHSALASESSGHGHRA